MNVKCKRIVRGKASGKLLLISDPINFLGKVDTLTGEFSDYKDPNIKQNLTKSILVFPNSVGSSVGAYTIFALKKNKVSPNGMICTNKVDITTASGCAISNIPLAFIDKTGLCMLNTHISELSNSGQIQIVLDTNRETIDVTL